jgi:hypothetical protein
MTLEEASEVLGEPTAMLHGVAVWSNRLRSIAVSLDGDGKVMDVRRTPLMTAVRPTCLGTDFKATERFGLLIHDAPFSSPCMPAFPRGCAANALRAR